MTFLAFLTILCGYYDAHKYLFEVGRIRKNKSSKDVSKRFVLVGIMTHLCIIIYVCGTRDYPMLAVWLMGLSTLAITYYHVWKYCDIRLLKLKKKPSFCRFLWMTLVELKYWLLIAVLACGSFFVLRYFL